MALVLVLDACRHVLVFWLTRIQFIPTCIGKFSLLCSNVLCLYTYPTITTIRRPIEKNVYNKNQFFNHYPLTY